MGRDGSAVTHDAHVYAWQQRELRRSLIRQLLRRHRELGTDWLRGYVKDWRMWAQELRVDFWKQQRAGNDGEHGKWIC